MSVQDEGCQDMYWVIRTLPAVGRRPVSPSGVPRLADSPWLATAYTIGGMKALQRCADEEVGPR